MSPSRRPSRRVPSKGRSLRNDAPLDSYASATSEPGDPGAGGTAARPGSRATNRAAKRAVTGVRPKTGLRKGSSGRSGSSNTAIILLAVAVVVIAGAVILIGNPFGTPAASALPTTPVVAGDGTCPTTQPAALPVGESRTVTITTPDGDIVIKVDGSLSPIAVGNFVTLVACHFYDGSVFHRTAALQDGTPFVIQGGAPKPGTASIPYSIQDETVTTTYKRGTLAMARSTQPNSQTSQFFVVLDDKAAPILVSNGNNYAILGEVIAGMDVVDAIYAASDGVEQPADPIPMTSVTVGPFPAASASPAPTAASTNAPTAAPTAAPTTAP